MHYLTGKTIWGYRNPCCNSNWSFPLMNKMSNDVRFDASWQTLSTTGRIKTGVWGRGQVMEACFIRNQVSLVARDINIKGRSSRAVT